MEFRTGQRLTAQNLNNLVDLADGQNIPTDGQFIKSTGVNMWTPIQAKPEVVKNHKIFDVQVRYHDINDRGQEKGEDYEANYKPFWYVYLGTDCVTTSVGNYDLWDLKIEAGSGVSLVPPMKVYSQPMPQEVTALDEFEFKDAVTQMVHCQLDATTHEVKNYKKFYAGKMLANQPQIINSDLNGWFCTGLPAYIVTGSDDEVKLMPNELYATFIRTSTEPLGITGNVFFSVLVFSNKPIVGLGALKKNGQYRVTLPDGTPIQYAEIMSDHSQKIGSFKITSDLKHGNYGVENTSMIPGDELSEEDHGWSIVKPTEISDDDTKAAQQLVNYEFVNTTFVSPQGLTLPFHGNDSDDGKTLNIYFSDLAAEDKPNDLVNAYYVDFSWTDDPEDDEPQELLEIKKINDIHGSMALMRGALDTIADLATVKIAAKNYEENPLTYHKLVAVFLLNTNGKISPDEGELIPWTIEYVKYIDMMPNFMNTLRYDTNLTDKASMSPTLQSIERDKIELTIDGESKQTYVDQIYGFNNPNYKLDSFEDLSAELLIRRHGQIDGKDVHRIEYLDLSTITELSGLSCDPYYGDADIEMTEQKSIKLYESDDHILQLYNFDQTSADIIAKIWPIGYMDSDRSRKTGRIIDAGSKDVLDVDILVRDNDSKELKYMQLSVEPVEVDTYATNTRLKSISYSRDQFADRDYLTLRNFGSQTTTKLSGVIHNNGVVDITDQNTWILTKKYNPQSNVMELTYDKLQLSVDLTAVSFDVKCDSDSTPAQKSIEKNDDYIQLYDFDAPAVTTKKTTIDKLSSTFDLLDSNDTVLVRSGTELKYKKLQIETKLPGGGGQTVGYTGSIVGDCTLKWNSRGTYRIELWGKDMTYENGLLKSVGNERLISELETVGYSGQ